MNKFAIAAALCGAFSLSHIARAQDTMSAAPMDNDLTMSADVTSTGMMSTMMAPAPSATVIRRYIDGSGNLSAVDVRFSSGMGTGQTRQLRIMPVLVARSEAAAAYGLGRIVTAVVSDAMIMAPPSFDPDASPSMMRGVIMPTGNTTPGMPSLGLTNNEMMAGGYKSGQEPMMDKKMMEGKDATK